MFIKSMIFQTSKSFYIHRKVMVIEKFLVISPYHGSYTLNETLCNDTPLLNQ